MRSSLFVASIAALIASMSMPVHAENYKRIKKSDDFNSMVVGKKLVWDDGNGVVYPDGTTKGKSNTAGKYYGNWVWQNGYYCRNLIIKGKETGTNCQKIEIDGSNLRMTRDKGKGRITMVTME